MNIHTRDSTATAAAVKHSTQPQQTLAYIGLLVCCFLWGFYCLYYNQTKKVGQQGLDNCCMRAGNIFVLLLITALVCFVGFDSFSDPCLKMVSNMSLWFFSPRPHLSSL